MKVLLDRIMWRRARQLSRRLGPALGPCNRLADVGSGTGHNGEVLRLAGVQVACFDIVDMHWVGPVPTLFDGRYLPAADDQVDAVTLLFVLQYCDDPRSLLEEARRLASSRVVVLQSSFRGVLGRVVLGARELVWGPLALRVARLVGAVSVEGDPLRSRRHYRRRELVELFGSAGLEVVRCTPSTWPGLGVSRDLFVLKPV